LDVFYSLVKIKGGGGVLSVLLGHSGTRPKAEGPLTYSQKNMRGEKKGYDLKKRRASAETG